MQQINLYLPEFQPNREPLRAVQMLWGMLVLVVLLAIASMVSSNSNKTLSARIETQRTQLEQLKRQLDEINKGQPQANLAALDAEILGLMNDLVRRERLVGIVSSTNLGNSSGFSGQLRAMARQSLETISLEAFSLSRGGNYAELMGNTLASDQVPLYVQRLRTEASFSKVAFGVLHIVPSEQQAGLLEFSLAEQMADEKSKEAPKTAVQMLLELNEQARSKP
jgi:hypothetical protein